MKWLLIAFFLTGIFLVTSCTRINAKSQNPSAPLRILLDPPPTTLNPRASLDVTSQRINELLFRALIRLDSNLTPQPDLAQSYEVLDSGKTWKFTIRQNQKDHEDHPIDPSNIRQCLENYRIGSPASVFKNALPHWIATESTQDAVILRLDAPDPDLARNLSLLRYFRTPQSTQSCSEPRSDSTLIGSGTYRAKKWDFSPNHPFQLIPVDPSLSQRTIELIFVDDDNTKALKLLRGEVDAIQVALSLTKTRWIEHHSDPQFKVLERPGVSTSYLAFNFKDPLLHRKEVRKAIALSIDREKIVRHKHLGFTEIAKSLLPPGVPEHLPSEFELNPSRAESLLDQAGFPRKKDGIRFQLHYKSTPVREGIETALMIKDMLSHIGIQVMIDVVEPAVFFASIKKGNFQLYSSRWIGISDGSILFRSLHSGQNLNRIHYQDPEMDQILDSAITELDSQRRKTLLYQAQTKIAEDLPYFPLWHWNVALILNSDLWLKNSDHFSAEKLSLSGSLEPLTHLR